MEPLQSSFSVAALLGDKLLQKTKAANTNVKRNDDGNARPGLPPTPQPSDSEEDEPLRKKRCVEQCELAKVSIIYCRYKHYICVFVTKLSLFDFFYPIDWPLQCT